MFLGFKAAHKKWRFLGAQHEKNPSASRRRA